MNIYEMVANLWANIANSSSLVPYIFKELDRKYNPNSRIRKLKETDPDLAKSLTGKVCLITGGSRGLGAEVVKALLRKDCHVITGSSSKNEEELKKRYVALMADIPDGKGKLEIWHLDLKSMDSVLAFANKFKKTNLRLNYFIANAGIMFKSSKLTSHGFDEHFAINYLSHCLLIDHIIENMYETGKQSNTESRIVLVSSCMHKWANISYDDLHLQKGQYPLYFAYGQSKLALIIFANRLALWFDQKGEDWLKYVTVNSLHPGLCDTELLSHFPIVKDMRPLIAQAFRSAREGAETTIYATLSSEMNGISGKYLEDSAIEHPSIDAMKVKDQNKLWDVTWNSLDKWTIHNWSQHT